ncbi:MAG: 5-(carboxyamino)imidazole ribonucleotide synthase [Bdellovibrionota bacterium]
MNPPKLTLGILGGGQLAQMLVENSPFSDLEISIFTKDLECPAKYTAGQLFKGDIKDEESLRRFFSKVNFITFENEFIDVEALGKIKNEFPKVFILPSIPNIQITQNKLSQKFLFQKLNLPTSPFKGFDPKIDQLLPWLRTTAFGHKNGFVLKRAMGGYDGKGNHVVKTLGELEKASEFCQKAIGEGTTVYAEEFVTFEKELAQVYTRSLNGDFIAYPLVISEQEKNVCKLVYGPATEFDIPKEIETETSAMGKKIGEELKFVGTFAIEYFYVNGKILINEMAPRVHNSGHYTLDAAPVNQFENHLFACLGSKLKSPSTYPYFAMRNILGPEGLEKTFEKDVKEKFKKTEDAKVYWYNKTKTSSYRKLGHINTISMTKTDLMLKIKLMEEIETNFWKNYE